MRFVTLCLFFVAAAFAAPLANPELGVVGEVRDAAVDVENPEACCL